MMMAASPVPEIASLSTAAVVGFPKSGQDLAPQRRFVCDQASAFLVRVGSGI
jgi:hypothetical protein